MEEQRAKEREYLRKKRAKEQLRELEKNSSKHNNNSNSKVVDLNYDNVELKPKIDEEPLNKKVNDKTEEENNNNVLIQKQSKDETTIEILSDTDSEKIAVK